MKRRKGLALLGLIALAAVFRLAGIGAIPPGLFIDEAQNGLDAWSITTGESRPLWIRVPGVEARGREPIYCYLVAGVFGLAGPRVEALRLTSALIGIATVGLFFLACERLMGLRFALLAGTLMAVGSWHASFSRIGMRAILVPLLVALAVLLFAELARRRTPGAAALFGVALGLGFYTYPSWWIVPPALLVVALVLLRRVGPEERRHALRLGAVAVVCAAATLGPLVVYALAHPERVFARAGESMEQAFTREPAGVVLRDNAQRVLLMLHFRGDPEARHNLPGRPLLDPVTGLAFLAGLAFALARCARGEPIWVGAVLLWLLPLLPSVVTEGAPHAMRTLGAAPAVLFLAAAGFELLWRVPALSETMRRGLVVALLAVVTLANGHRLLAWGRDPRIAEHFSAGILPFVELLADLATENEVYLSPHLYHTPNIRFLNLSRGAVVKLIDSPAFLLAPEGADRDRVVVSESTELQLLLDTLYPEAEPVTRFSTYAGPTGRVDRIPRESLRPGLEPHQAAVAEHLVGRARQRFEQTAAAW